MPVDKKRGAFVRPHVESYWSMMGRTFTGKKKAKRGDHAPMFGQPGGSHQQAHMPSQQRSFDDLIGNAAWNRAQEHPRSQNGSMRGSQHSFGPLGNNPHSPGVRSMGGGSIRSAAGGVGPPPGTQVPRSHHGPGVRPSELRAHMGHGGGTARGEHVRGFDGSSHYPGSRNASMHSSVRSGGERGGITNGGEGRRWEAGNTEFGAAETRGRTGRR